MEIKDAITTGGLLLVGITALKAFGGIEGLAGMFGGIKDIFTGVGEAVETVTDPPSYIRPPDLPPDVELPIPPPDWWEFMFPPAALLPDEPQKIPPPIQLPPVISYIFPPLGFWDLLNPPPVAPPPVAPPPVAPPAYIPTEPVTYQPDPIVTPPDPGHPATDPWLGGR